MPLIVGLDNLGINPIKLKDLVVKISKKYGDKNKKSKYVSQPINIPWEKFLKEDEETNPEGKDIAIYPQCFRHYIVTHLSRIGLESDFIIAIMGWKSADMYSIYNDLTAKEKGWKSLDKLKDSLKKV